MPEGSQGRADRALRHEPRDLLEIPARGRIRFFLPFHEFVNAAIHVERGDDALGDLVLHLDQPPERTVADAWYCRRELLFLLTRRMMFAT